MRVFRWLILFCLVGCASPTPLNSRRVGASITVGTVVWVKSIPAITGNNATIDLYDTTVSPTTIFVNRIMYTGRCDQAITLNYQILRDGSSTWRTMNNNGSGDTVAANTDTAIDYLVLGPNSRLEAVTGGTGPSTCETSIALFGDRELGM